MRLDRTDECDFLVGPPHVFHRTCEGLVLRTANHVPFPWADGALSRNRNTVEPQRNAPRTVRETRKKSERDTEVENYVCIQRRVCLIYCREEHLVRVVPDFVTERLRRGFCD